MGMKREVPNVANAVVEDLKMAGYLLNLSHPEGNSKAVFFIQRGFSVDDLPAFREMLIHHAKINVVAKYERTKRGDKFIVEGPVNWVDVNNFNLRTVWFISNGLEIPRLVTA